MTDRDLETDLRRELYALQPDYDDARATVMLDRATLAAPSTHRDRRRVTTWIAVGASVAGAAVAGGAIALSTSSNSANGPAPREARGGSSPSTSGTLTWSPSSPISAGCAAKTILLGPVPVGGPSGARRTVAAAGVNLSCLKPGHCVTITIPSSASAGTVPIVVGSCRSTEPSRPSSTPSTHAK